LLKGTLKRYNIIMIKQRPKLKRTACLLYEEEIKAVTKGAKMYKISKNHYKRGAIITQLQSDGLLKK
jgi:hypothetical protein